MLLTQEITISILCHQSCATTLTRKISYQVTSHRRSYKISLYIYQGNKGMQTQTQKAPTLQLHKNYMASHIQIAD